MTMVTVSRPPLAGPTTEKLSLCLTAAAAAPGTGEELDVITSTVDPSRHLFNHRMGLVQLSLLLSSSHGGVGVIALPSNSSVGS
jgi:hypothetical protein